MYLINPQVITQLTKKLKLLGQTLTEVRTPTHPLMCVRFKVICHFVY